MRNLVRKQSGDSYQVFADLVFCKLIALLLFILVLALEVNARVRAEDVQPIPEVEMVEAETLEEALNQIRELREELEIAQETYDELLAEFSDVKIQLEKTEAERQRLVAVNQKQAEELEELRKLKDDQLGNVYLHTVGAWKGGSRASKSDLVRAYSQGLQMKNSTARIVSEVDEAVRDLPNDATLEPVMFIYIILGMRR